MSTPVIGSVGNLWRLTGGQRLRYALALGALALESVCLFAVPLLTMAVIDELLLPDAARTGRPWMAPLRELRQDGSLGRALLVAAGAAVSITALAGSFQYLRGRLAAQASESIVRRLRDHLFSHLHALPCATHDRMDTGDLVQRCTSDVETLRVFLAAQVVEIGRASLLLMTVLPIMLWVQPAMSAVALGLLPVVVGFALVYFRRVRQVFQEVDEAEGEMTSVLQENLTNVRVVRAFAMQQAEIRRLDEHNGRFRDLSLKLMKQLANYWAISDFLCLAQVGLMLVVGAWWVQSGWMSVGELIAFIAWQNLVVWPVRHMGRVLSDTGKALVSLRRVEEILSEPEEDVREDVRDAVPDGVPGALRGEIEFRGLSFGYPGGEEVLHDVHLRVPAGRSLALLGPPGSGKSTLVQLLLRLYDPPRGTVFLDGVDLLDLPRQWLRSQCGVVLQEPFLASRSLDENLRFGRESASREEVEAACVVASVHESIASFAHGYETRIGERGVTLSGGQRQRVALARALLVDPALLILDDALSAVDTQTETRIVEALRRRRLRGSTLIVSHRLSTIRHADHIVVLDAGRITQSGTHEELLAREGSYQRLWAAQGGLEELLSSGVEAAEADGGTSSESGSSGRAAGGGISSGGGAAE